eukprot:TRINITY_DN10962_c0_g3_i1.p1 TRINITY_DN10962_c0_g3~~TRINITY_DN10962_c0_g3_i1.p1  ORF type:complete len:246 (-),score=56.70 TRINITY_DN10962_c0_g3_i1:115-798(-)
MAASPVAYPRAHKAAQALFKLYDTDGSGAIDSNEVQAFVTSLGASLGQQNPASILERMDLNHDGKIDLQEFSAFIVDKLLAKFKPNEEKVVAILNSLRQMMLKQLAQSQDAVQARRSVNNVDYDAVGRTAESVARHVFLLYDRDHSGSVEVKEIAEAMSVLSVSDADNKARELIRKMDSDRSGQIDEEEFVRYILDSFRSSLENEEQVIISLEVIASKLRQQYAQQN